MQDLESTIISEYANSPRIVAMVTNINTYIDPSADIDLFYTSVMDILSAGTYGLDVWGRILGIGRVVRVPTADLYFGFSEAGHYSAVSFAESGDPGTFWDGTSPTTAPYTLDNASYLLLLLAKALYNITDCSIPAINQILLNLFPGRGNAWVSDGLNMTMTYNFSFVLTALETAILAQSGALPKPVGVSILVAL